jgi:glutaconate CoA-transferase subunit A
MVLLGSDYRTCMPVIASYGIMRPNVYNPAPPAVERHGDVGAMGRVTTLRYGRAGARSGVVPEIYDAGRAARGRQGGIGRRTMSEFLGLSEAVARLVTPGARVALEGFTHLIPFAAGHEIIRQRLSDLTLIRMTPDLIYDQMIGAGCASTLIFSWGGNPGVGSLHRLRDAVEHGWPRPLQIEEHSHAAMAQAYAAGAAGMPSAFFRGYHGSELARVNPNIRFVACPFTGETLAAVPAHRPDVSIVHAQRADRAGNVLLEGIVGVQKEAVLAARASIVTVEEVVDSFGDTGRNAVILPSWAVTAIAVVPGGAHPSYAHGYYARDNAFYVSWDAVSRDRARFEAWIREHVTEATPEAFQARVAAGAAR